MPINDPIQNRKVAPGSLAFERRRMVYGTAYAGEEPEGDVYNYQYYVDLNYNVTVNNIVTKPFLQSELNRVMTAINKAEHRAKHYASDFKQSFQWDLTNNWQFFTGTWTAVPFGNEILRTPGIMNESFDYDDGWSFRPTDANKGVWWVNAFVMIKFPASGDVTEARLAFYINGFPFREVDLVDAHMMGHNKMEDCRLSGGCHVPLKAGDKLEVKMYTAVVTPEDSGVLYPTSIYAYVTGHRENCEYNKTENEQSIGNGYVFEKGEPAP